MTGPACLASSGLCPLYPIAFHADSIVDAEPDGMLPDLFNGQGPGQFGWLSWSGSPSTTTLIRSLTPPGDSFDYVNPDNPLDHVLEPDEWVTGKPGLSNAAATRRALDALLGREIVVGVWDTTRGQGEKAAYHIVSFAHVQVLEYALAGQNRIRARFLKPASCANINTPPQVDAGPDLNAPLGVIQLAGTAVDDGRPHPSLTIQWSQTAGPAEVTFSEPHRLETLAHFPEPGIYTLQLSAFDGEFTAADSLCVILDRANQVPVALPQSLELLEDSPIEIELQGDDPESAPLTFRIDLAPNHGQLSGAPPLLHYTPDPDYNGSDRFTFSVSDGELASSPAGIELSIRAVNDPPVADPLTIQTDEDQGLRLQLSGSDVEGAPLRFEILQTLQNAELSPDPAHPGLLWIQPYPDFYGLDAFTFQVSDGELRSEPALVQVEVVPLNDPPRVDAGPNVTTTPQTPFELSGAVTDDGTPGSQPLTVTWIKVAGPGPIRFADPLTAATHAIAGEPGTYTLQLSATDSIEASADTLTLRVRTSDVNLPPTVDAGPDQTIGSTRQTRLSGTAFDDDFAGEGHLQVRWTQRSGPGTASMAEPTTAEPTVHFSEDGVYVLELEADDGTLKASDTVSITVHTSNLPPRADAGPDQTVAWLDDQSTGIRTDIPRGGRIVVSNDEWPLSDRGFYTTPTTGTFVLNVADWFTEGRPGTFLGYSDDFSITGASLAATLRAAGHSWIVDATLPCTLENLLAFDALWIVNLEVDLEVLTRYVQAGGCVYLASGTGQSLPGGEPGFWNTFLRNFGLAFSPSYHGIAGSIALEDSHPILHDVDALYMNNGNYVRELNPIDPTTRIIAGNPDTGLIGVFDPNLEPLRLQGLAFDDGQPGGVPLNFHWRQIDGPSPATLNSPQLAATTVVFPTPGTYSFELTVSDSLLETTDDVTITLTENPIPSVDAGPDERLTLPEALQCQGHVVDPSTPDSELRINWELISGPGPVSFENASHPQTTTHFSEPGRYMLQLNAANSSFRSADQVALDIFLPPAPLGRSRNLWLALDHSLTDQTGSLSAEPAGNLTFTPGYAGEALAFDGTTTLLRLPLNPLTNPSESIRGLTVEAWILPTGDFLPRPLLTWAHPYSQGTVEWWLHQPTAGGLKATFINAGGETCTVASPSTRHPADPLSVQLGRFQHVALTYDVESGSATLYLNAAIVAQANLGSFQPQTQPNLYIGHDPGNGNRYRGLLDEFAIHHRALHPDEIARITHAGPNGCPKNLEIDAGPDSAVHVGQPLPLNATVRGGTIPLGHIPSVQWTLLEAAGPASFAEPKALHTQVRFDTPGTYLLQITAGNTPNDVSDTLTVQAFPAENVNQAPRVHAGPDLTVPLHAVWTPQAQVTDDHLPTGTTLRLAWHTVTAPGSVTFDHPDSLHPHVWFSRPGIHTLQLTADDSLLKSTDEITVTVLENQPPLVDAGPDLTTSTPKIFLRGSVTDDALFTPDLLTTWSVIRGPAPVTIDSPDDLVSAVRLASPGSYLFQLRADDGSLQASDQVLVEYRPSLNQAPIVDAGADRVVPLEQPTVLQAQVKDDGMPRGVLQTTWRQLSGPGSATLSQLNNLDTVSFELAGLYTLELQASDGELMAADTISLIVVPTPPPPTATLLAPLASGEITAPIPVMGSVSSPILDRWHLEFQPLPSTPEGTWQTLNSSSQPVSQSTLGIFDPTTLPNGLYQLRLWAVDQLGQITTSEPTAVAVRGALKPGRFRLSFKDLELPIPGIPLGIIRTYDSFDAHSGRHGDFGAGWSLEIRSPKLAKSEALDRDWIALQSGAWYTITPARPKCVTVTLPDQQVLMFAPVLSPALQFGVPIASVSLTFTNLSGTGHTLAVDGPSRADVDGYVGPVNLIDLAGFTRFDPVRFRLKTAHGTTYVLDETTGLQQIVDPTGAVLTVNHFGVTHTSGWSVQFSRDPQGRITLITTPDDRSFHYDYDPAGNLLEFNAPEFLSHHFTYDHQHRLLTLRDEEDTPLFRNTFDPQGRLISQLDALGRALTFTHNLEDRLDLVADRLGHLTTHAYDARGNVVRTTDPLGAVTNYRYDDRDNLIETVDALGHRTTHSYDPHSNLLTTTDALGYTTHYEYDSMDQLTRITDPLGRTTDYAYDPQGNLIAETAPDGAVTRHTYDNHGLRHTTTNPQNHVTQFDYDDHGLLTRITDPLGHTLTFVHDAAGKVIEQRTPRTRPDQTVVTQVTRFEYDRLNRLTAAIAPDQSVTRILYHPSGRPSLITDPLNRLTSLDYDTLGRPLQITFPDGTTQGVGYDAEGRRTALTNELGSVTQFTLDPLGRILAIESPDHTRTTLDYDLAGRRVAMTQPSGETTRFSYDPRGQISTITDPLGQVTRYEHDPAGQLVATTDPLGNTTRFQYDPCGRITETIRADGSRLSTLYDIAGNPIRQTDAAGFVTTTTYDPLGHLLSVTDPLGHSTHYDYNASGGLIARTDANDHTTLYERDLLDRLTRRILPSGDSETFHYDSASRLLRHTDFNGDVTSFEYDNRDRLLARYPDPRWNEPPIRYTYDDAGRRVGMEDPLGRSTYEHDTLGRLIATTRHNHIPNPAASLAARIDYTYDANGNLIATRSAQHNGVDIHYARDPLGRLAGVQDTRLGETHYTYDPAGNLTHTTRPNGVHTLRQYDALHRLTNMVIARFDSVIAQYAYALAPSGRRLHAEEHLQTNTGWRLTLRDYAYDPAGRLVRETLTTPPQTPVTLDYAYDPVGNRLSRRSSSEALSSTTSTYTPHNGLVPDRYDLNGNTITGISPLGDPVTCLYNSRNELIRTLLPDGTSVDFHHDGDGRRWARIFTSPGQPASTTWTVPDPNNPTGWTQPLEELQVLNPEDPNPAITRTYTWGHQLLAQDQLLQNSWSAHWYGRDGHHDIRFLQNPAGQITDTYDYDAFGNLIATSGTTPNLHGFAGEASDPDLGFLDLRARQLNPNTGRFWTRDRFPGSLRHPSSQHPYLYCGGDPVNAWDPSGAITLTEAHATTTIASIIHAMAVYHGTDTLLQGQQELSNLGLARPELYEAVEIALLYQLFSDSTALFHTGRSVPALSRFLLSKAPSALHRLARLSPRQWLQLKLSSPKQLAQSISQAEYTVNVGGVAAAPARQMEFGFVHSVQPRPNLIYPPRSGFDGSSGQASLIPGTRIDRYGPLSGRFASPQGTPFIQRSLPPSAAQAEYGVYEVMKTFEVEAGRTARWFNMPGGGIQYHLPMSVDELLQQGYIREAYE